ncbi:GNAT family N-acetyltransferase [Actinoplanes sp. NPDC049596]|uniref:GNAT family N-acetyltransferase n=1 Tax=unclassified Actinoplanes TaxID=2626549 RepID=UPI00343B62AE
MLLERRDDGYELSSEPERIDLPLVHRWLSTDAYWAMGRPIEEVRTAFAGSDAFGIYRDGGEQVAVARVINDGAVFAYLCDVYVDRAHRGRGLGGWMARGLRDHYAELGLKRLLLTTRDAQPVYAAQGFVEVDPGRWMACDLAAVRAAAKA